MASQDKIIDFSIVGGRILSLMREKGKSQTSLGLETGIKQATISDYVKGNSVPSAERFYLIAEALGVSMDFLLLGEKKESCDVNWEKRALAAEKENAILKERIETLGMAIRAVLEKFEA